MALAWDGAYYLFKTLDEGVPFISLSRYSNALFEAPVVLARHAGVEDFRILRPLFVAPYALIPLASLALSWWIVREKRPGIFVWPVLSMTLANLPGAFFMVSEGPIATALFWPILLALLVGRVTPLQLALLIVAGALALVTHPIAVPLFAAAGLLAVFQGWRGAWGTRRSRAWVVGVLFLALAAAKSLAPLSDYESRNLSLTSFTDPFHAATWGWPRISLASTLTGTLLVMLQPWLLPRIRSKGGAVVFTYAAAAFAAAAGIAMVPWARNASNWSNALNYRFVMNVLSAGFFTLATLEGLFGPLSREARSVPLERALAGRRAVTQAAGLAFLVTFALQGTTWSNLCARFVRDLEATSGRCTPLSRLPTAGTPLTHWSSTSLSIVLQGRAPHHLAMNEDGCDELGRTSAVRIAPWDCRAPGHGWFQLPR